MTLSLTPVMIPMTEDHSANGLFMHGLIFSATTTYPLVVFSDASFAPMTGGSTNQTYRVDAPTELPQTIIRCLNSSDNFTISRSNELEATRVMSEEGIGPKLFSYSSHRMILEYIQGEHIYGAQILQPSNLYPLMEMLRKFHHSAADLEFVDRVESIEAFIQTAEENGVSIPDEIIDGLHLIKKLYPLQLPRILCPTHGDFDGTNFLFTLSGPRVIDFDYSALGDPLYDVAKLSVIENFSLEDCQQLLFAYDPNAGERELFRLHYNRLVAATWGAAWHLLRKGLCFEPSQIEHLNRRTVIRVEQFRNVFDQVSKLSSRVVDAI